MKKLNLSETVFYQSASKFDNNPVEVTVIKSTAKTATVRAKILNTIEFTCRLSSLYN